jgi:hypothetical protein
MAAADSANTGALLKQVYGDLADPLAPEDSFARDVKFMTGKKIGREYYWPVRLGLELGVSFSLTHNAYALGNAVDAIYQDATVSGAEMTVRSQISYGQMSTLSESKGDSAKAYDQGVAIKILGMTQGHELFREMQLWYGPGSATAAPLASNIGVVSATGVSGTPVAGSCYLTTTRASWIPGFWQNFQNGLFDLYNGATKINVGGALQVTGVDVLKCRIAVTPLVGTDLALIANNAIGVVASTIQFHDAVGNSMLGFQGIAETSGSVFGISNITYPQWKVINFAVNGVLTFDNVTGALSVAADNGLKRGGKLYICNRTWTDLLNDEVALRRYFGDEMGGKATPGFKELEFITATGVIQIKPYQYMKQGNAAFVPMDVWHRVGSSDITATLPGQPDEFFFLQLPSNNGAELRTYSDQALIADFFFTTIWFTGLENSFDSLPSLS